MKWFAQDPTFGAQRGINQQRVKMDDNIDMKPSGIRPFNDSVDPECIDLEWSDWKRDFEIWCELKGDLSQEKKLLWLMNKGGRELRRIYDTLKPVKNEKTVRPPLAELQYDNAIIRLDEYFVSKSNPILLMDAFRRLAQEPKESFNKFVLRLRRHAKRCNFINMDTEEQNIHQQIANGARVKKVREKAIVGNLTLDELVKYANAQEVLENQNKEKESGDPDTIGYVQREKSKFRRTPYDGQSRWKPSKTFNRDFDRRVESRSCAKCGRNHGAFQSCAAKGQKCFKCDGIGHFAAMCKSNKRKFNSNENFTDVIPKRKINSIKQDNQPDDDDDWYDYTPIKPKSDNDKKILDNDGLIDCYVADTKIRFIIDSGSPVNTITEKAWNMLMENNAKLYGVKMRSDREFYGYGNDNPLTVIREFKAKLVINDQKPSTVAQFIVVKGATRSLLGKPTAEEVRVLKVGLRVQSIEKMKLKKLENFPKVPNLQIKFEIDKTVIPKKTPYFRVPFAVEDLVDSKLQELLNKDIIEHVTTSTEWISPLVVVPKGKDDVRICVDMRNPNKAIKRIHHPLPVIEDFLPKLKGAKIFSRMDISSAYHHLELHPSSREITTFMTRKGLMRYKRLAFGVNCAPEIFQKFMEEILLGIESCMVMLDDIIIFGKTREEHDERLKMVVERLRRNNLTINEKKCLYNVTELEFLGFHISTTGIKPAKSKVEAIKNFRRPESAAEVSSFLGLVNFVGSFISNLSDKTEPLRRIITSNFQWEPEQEKAFIGLQKELISHAIELGYYDRESKTFLAVDASPIGLGAVLFQEHRNKNGENEKRVIAFASKTLTETEKKYPQTQREALALVWAVERFYIYLFGLKFTIYTDHEAHKFIFGGKTKIIGKRALTRAESWALRLQCYEFDVVYCKGKDNIADVLSRLCCKNDGPFEEESPHYLYAVTSWDREGKTITMNDIRENSINDPITLEVIKALRNNKWEDNKTIISYRAFSKELHEQNGVLMRENRAVIPNNLRMCVLKVAHKGHPGSVTMKRLIRSRVWWPGMDIDIDKYVNNCLACISVSRCNPPEELIRAELPLQAWDHVAIDFLTIPELNISLLVLVDYYSRYVCVEAIKVTDAVKTIEVLENWFDVWGYPKCIRSDNGQPFASTHMKEYFQSKGINHELTTPYSPQQNGEVERQNTGITRALKIAKIEKIPWKEALKEYLNAYNRRPHSVTQVSPLSLMTGRQIHDALPERISTTGSEEEWKERDRIEKLKGKLYADKRRHAKPSEIEAGDIVMVKNRETGKLQPNFELTPFQVVEKKSGEVLLRRHVTHVKKWPENQDCDKTENESTGNGGLIQKESKTNEKNEKRNCSPRRSTRIQENQKKSAE